MSEVIVTEAENGREVSVSPGDTIVLRLGENPTTGYRWSLVSDPELLSLEGDSFEPMVPPLFGSGGTREFRFQARGSGTGELSLRCFQPWEQPESGASEFSLRILSQPRT